MSTRLASATWLQPCMLLDRRRSGVLLHPTSLPGRYGIGDLGPGRVRLPRLPGPRHAVAVAGPAARPDRLRRLAVRQPVGIRRQPAADLARAADRPGPARRRRRCAELASPASRPRRLRPPAAAQAASSCRRPSNAARERAARRQLERFRGHDTPPGSTTSRCSRRSRTSTARAWTEWDARPARSRTRRAGRRATRSCAERIDFHVFCQFLFFEQWAAVRAAAHANGHRHHRRHPDLRRPRQRRRLGPPGTCSSSTTTGQPQRRRRRAARLLQRDRPALGQPALRLGGDGRRRLRLVDRALPATCSNWSTWCGSTTSAASRPPGKCRPAPPRRSTARGSKAPARRSSTRSRARSAAVSRRSIAEDLGLITDEVRALLEATGFPGMKVLQFAFGGDAGQSVPAAQLRRSELRRLHRHARQRHHARLVRRCARARARRTRALPGHATARDIAEDLIRLALQSIADTAIVPLQDVLDLGSEARMNTPGAPQGNWAWRVAGRPARSAPRADCLAEMTITYGRSQTDQ